MALQGTILAGPDAPDLDLGAWLALIEEDPRFSPLLRKNPFTGEMMQVEGDRDAARVMHGDAEVGRMCWSRSGMCSVVVEGDAEHTIVVAEDVAARLGGRFRRFVPADADAADVAQRAIEYLLERRIEEAKVLGRELLDAGGFALALAHVGHRNPVVGANMALLAGTLGERGAAVGDLAPAILDPMAKAIISAGRFVASLRVHSDDDPDEIVKAITRAAKRRPKRHAAFRSLDAWAPAAAAALSHDLRALAKLRARADVAAALLLLSAWSEGALCLRILLSTPIDAPFVVLIPELDEAYAFELSGCVDVGQLSVLLSHELREPLRSVTASKPASKDLLRVMDGTGPQHSDEVYECGFELYPWQAIDPADGMPKDARFVWQAPGGRGSHSLPQDFLVGELEPIDGTRVMALVGPKSMNDAIRVFAGTRVFPALRVTIRDTRRIEESERKRWLGHVNREAAGVAPPDPKDLRDAPPRKQDGVSPRRLRTLTYAVLFVMLVVVAIVLIALWRQAQRNALPS